MALTYKDVSASISMLADIVSNDSKIGLITLTLNRMTHGTEADIRCENVDIRDLIGLVCEIIYATKKTDNEITMNEFIEMLMKGNKIFTEHNKTKNK